MNDEPQNYTLMLVSNFFKSNWVTIFFKDYDKYDDLPNVVKSPDTKIQYDAWWNWYNNQKGQA